MSKSNPVTPHKKAPRTLATGGGNATASGVNFQQSLGAVFGLWLIIETPVDPRLQLGNARITAFRMETEAPLDDAFATTSDDGIICAQAKNTLSLSDSPASEFGKTVDQIVRQWRLCRDGTGDLEWNRPLDPAKDRLLIVVGPKSPETTRHNLAKGLEARRQPGAPVLTASETKALRKFDACVQRSWVATGTTDPLDDGTLQAISRLTYVYTIDPEGSDRGAWAAALGPALQKQAEGPSVLNLLERIAGDLMGERGGRTLPTLRADLMARGARLAARPDFRKDIDTLTDYSHQTERILAELEVVEAGDDDVVGITRHCQSVVNAAALGGHLLLIGEPGAGKSAVMNALGKELRSRGSDVVQLAVDRFSVESLEGVSRALRLDHDLPAVLDAWDGPGPAFLLIDALDASRGRSGEAAFKRLIESVIELGGRWTVVASIRIFDLQLGQNFRSLFKGTPPEKKLQGEGFANVRHIQIPPWSNDEFAELLSRTPRLAEVLAHCSAKLRELTMVPFNTRLVANLVATGALSQDFTGIDSQIALLNLYWDERIRPHGVTAEVCLRAIVEHMVAAGALRAQRLKVAIASPAMLETLTGEGVLISTNAERSVHFRHHLLFDYIASRVFLDPDGIVDGAAPFPKAQGLGLLLAPAMGFLLQALWAEDTDHNRFWTVVSTLLSAPNCDPVIRSVAARMAAELPVVFADIDAFATKINGRSAAEIAALPRVMGAMAVRLEDEPSVPLAPWVHLVLTLSAQPEPVAGVLRMMGFMLVKRVHDANLRTSLGIAVRALLTYGFTLEDSQELATPAIGFVADTITTNVDASVALLRQVLSKDRFDRFAPQELPALAQKIRQIAVASPGFAVEVYQSAFAGQITENRQTSIGNSRILNLTSNARQDFEAARWSLKEYFPHFLSMSPVQGTEALIKALDGYVAREHPRSESLAVLSFTVDSIAVHLQPDYSHIWAHDPHPKYAKDADDLLSQFLTWLKTGEESAVLAAVDHAVLFCRLGVLWSRLFMAAAERGGVLAQRLRPYAASPEFLLTPDTCKDAIDLLAAQYDQLSETERRALETGMLTRPFDEYVHPKAAKEDFLRRLFGTIGAERLSTDEARAVLTAAPESVTTNNRLYRLTSGWVEAHDDYRWLSQEARENPVIRETIADIDLVRETLRLGTEDNEPIEDREAVLAALGELYDRLKDEAIPDRHLLHQAEGSFAQGLHELVRSDLIGPNTGRGTVVQLLAWIDDASHLSNPEVNENTEKKFEESPSWGAPSARFEAAAAALELCCKRPEVYPQLETLIDRMLNDPHPAVRMNTVLHLVKIWNIDRAGFWRRAVQVVQTEANRSVLDAFVSHIVERLVWQEADREVADLVLSMVRCFPANDARTKTIRYRLVGCLLQLWFRFEFEDAAFQVRAWFDNIADNPEEVRYGIQWLRWAFTAGLRSQDKSDLAIQRRLAIDLLGRAVSQAGIALHRYKTLTEPSEAESIRARQAMQIIDMACQQLYFSSGAAGHGDAAPAPLSRESAATFLHETASILRQIGQHGSPHTVYYLIQLLENLIEADPAGVFDLIAAAVLQGGKATGYQFEHLACDLMVKLTGRFLADHKEIFDDPPRRTALVDTLEVFVAVGWPSIWRLLYRLPGLLQ